MSTVHKLEQRAAEAGRNITEACAIFRAANAARRLAKSSPAAGDAGVNVRATSGTQQDAALPRFAAPQTVNGDGSPIKPTTPAIIGPKVSPILGNGTVKLPGIDTSRVAAVAPKSGANEQPFHAMRDLPQGGHPSAIPLLEQHGISVGVQAGVLVIQRKYVPAATGLLQTLAGGR